MANNAGTVCEGEALLMFQRGIRAGELCLILLVALLIAAAPSQPVEAAMPFAGSVRAGEMPQQSLLHKVDVFRECQKIHWCSASRDGTPRCGPTLRCRTCKFIRTCTRSLGCVWSEKCRWGPYVPPQQQ